LSLFVGIHFRYLPLSVFDSSSSLDSALVVLTGNVSRQFGHMSLPDDFTRRCCRDEGQDDHLSLIISG